MIGRAIALLDYLYLDDSYTEDGFTDEDYDLELWFWVRGLM